MKFIGGIWVLKGYGYKTRLVIIFGVICSMLLLSVTPLFAATNDLSSFTNRTDANAHAHAQNLDKSNKFHYKVYQLQGTNPMQDVLIKSFVNKKDAITYTQTLENSKVIYVKTNTVIWNDLDRYQVYQLQGDLSQDVLVKSFTNLTNAITYAQNFNNTSIVDVETNTVIWYNMYRYKVYQLQGADLSQDVLVKSFTDQVEAIDYAQTLANGNVVDVKTNTIIWSGR